MEIIHRICCGIDVHAKTVVVTGMEGFRVRLAICNSQLQTNFLHDRLSVSPLRSCAIREVS